MNDQNFQFLKGLSPKEIYGDMLNTLNSVVEDVCVPTPENVDDVSEMILNIAYESVFHAVHSNFGMKQLSAKWNPKCLKADQKGLRVITFKLICTRFNEDT